MEGYDEAHHPVGTPFEVFYVMYNMEYFCSLHTLHVLMYFDRYKRCEWHTYIRYKTKDSSWENKIERKNNSVGYYCPWISGYNIFASFIIFL